MQWSLDLFLEIGGGDTAFVFPAEAKSEYSETEAFQEFAQNLTGRAALGVDRIRPETQMRLTFSTNYSHV